MRKRCIRITSNDKESDYETLLEKSSRATMNIRETRSLAIEIFRSINILNPYLRKKYSQQK